MTPERAREIVAAICDRAFYAMGVGDQKPGSLKGVALADMLEATRIVEAENDAPSIDGKKTIRTVPAERLIAAVFALENYDHGDEAIAAVPYRGMRGDVKVIAVQAIDRATAEQEDEDEAA